MVAKETRLEIGRVLAGKWRIDGKLGEGGMATVWSGAHRNGMRVAIKALRAELGSNTDVRERFLREGYVANHIGHPGVVTVLDDDTSEDGVVFLVMELLEGSSLKELWHERNRQLPPSEVVLVTMGLLDVLAAAHDKGVIHRDIKPDNVFILKDGSIRILDFGIARLHEIDVIDQRTRTGSMLGTPAFMPPEQALGHWDEVDARTDLFAVGASMWTLLTGALVHTTRTVQELLVAAATAQARPIRELLPALDPRLAHVIDRALRFERSERWESARHMAAALAPVLRAGAVTDIMPERPPPPDSGVGVHGSWDSVNASPAHRIDTPTASVLDTPTASVLDTPTKLMPESSFGAPPTRRLITPPTHPTVDDASPDDASVASSHTPAPIPQPQAEPPPSRKRSNAIPLSIAALLILAALIGGGAMRWGPDTSMRTPSTPHVPSNQALTAPTPQAPPPAAAPNPSSPPQPTLQPRPTLQPQPSLQPRPFPKPPPAPSPHPPPPPKLDCAGSDFSNPACATR